jgi:hypothetical protein
MDINKESTIININHKKFSYGYFHWSKGINFFYNENNKDFPIDQNLLNNFLLELSDVIKKYPKSIVVIGGFNPKDFKWINYLQKLHSNKFFYLNQLTNGQNNNIFFNLLKYYNGVLNLEEEIKDEITNMLEKLIL